MRQPLLGVLVLLCSFAAPAQDVTSPNGRLVFSLGTSEQGVAVYEVRLDGKLVVQPSGLGLRFNAQPAFRESFELVDVERASLDETWEQPWGERRRVRTHYNEAVFTLRETKAPRRKLSVRARVFNDGIGFRYEVPAWGDVDRVSILDEITAFRLGEAEAWWQPDGDEGYEHLYGHSAVDDVGMAHTPLTAKTDSGVYLSIHEAALVDYSGYRLEAAGLGGLLRMRLRKWDAGAVGEAGTAVETALPFRTPWRTIQVADSAVGLLNSDLILNLNEPNRLGDVSWVEPGKYAGIWWEIHRGLGTWSSGPEHAATTDAVKAKIDFASEYGFSGVLAEGWNVGWDGDYVGEPTQDLTTPAADFDIAAVSNYAREKGVRLVGHHETGGHVTHYELQMEAAFDLLKAHDVRQVKTGYVGRTGSLKRVDDKGETHLEHKDGQYAVRHHARVIEAAAKRRISINTHEPVKDTGLRRTYPNWLSREGSRGQEFNIWGNPGNPPTHEVLLAYTRLLSGPMDFTPGIFDLDFDVRGVARRVQTTLAKQLALYVTIYSPIQMVPDMRENYERYRDAFQFIVDVPTDWEQSVAVAGEIGEYVVFARKERGGDDWFLGAITDGSERELALPLSFLDDGDYEATIYRDGDDADWATNPYDYVIETQTLNKNKRLEIRLAPGGGAAIRFRPKG